VHDRGRVDDEGEEYVVKVDGKSLSEKGDYGNRERKV